MKNRALRTNLTTYFTNLFSRYNVNPSNGKLEVFQWGQVIQIEGTDSNRIKVRIPVIDDLFYYDDDNNLKEELQDETIPWCVPANSKSVDTPDLNSVVLVALMDTSNPFNGRVWFSEITALSTKQLFSYLEEGVKGKKAWKEVQKSLGLNYNYFPGERNGSEFKDLKTEIKYKSGLRGKNKNALKFDKDETILIQGEGEGSEAKLTLSETTKLNAKKFEILSTDSSKTQNPVFATPLFDYESDVFTILQTIVTILAQPGSISTPSPGSLVIPNAQVTDLAKSIAQLKGSLEKLKNNGKSKYLKIN